MERESQLSNPTFLRGERVQNGGGKIGQDKVYLRKSGHLMMADIEVVHSY